MSDREERQPGAATWNDRWCRVWDATWKTEIGGCEGAVATVQVPVPDVPSGALRVERAGIETVQLEDVRSAGRRAPGAADRRVRSLRTDVAAGSAGRVPGRKLDTPGMACSTVLPPARLAPRLDPVRERQHLRFRSTAVLRAHPVELRERPTWRPAALLGTLAGGLSTVVAASRTREFWEHATACALMASWIVWMVFF